DIALGASLDAADGEDGHCCGRHLTGHNGLQPDHDHRCQYYRVDCRLRHRTVRATAVDDHPHAVRGGQHRPGVRADLARRERHDVLGERDVDTWDDPGQVVVDHAAGSVPGFFRRLEQDDEGAAPNCRTAGEEPGGAQQACHVDVMAAGVHHRNLVAVLVGAGGCTCVGQIGCFPHRQ